MSQVYLPSPLSHSAVLFLLLLAACSDLASEAPPVPDSTMVDVLVVLHLAEQREALQADLSPALRDSVLARHGLDTATYADAIAFYAAHPERYAGLYEDVIERLETERRRGDTLGVLRPGSDTRSAED